MVVSPRINRGVRFRASHATHSLASFGEDSDNMITSLDMRARRLHIWLLIAYLNQNLRAFCAGLYISCPVGYFYL